MAQKIGKYEVIEELGRGAMGVVYKARDPFIGRMVALKTITTGLQDQPELLQRFYREAQAAGGLAHPNIVTIFDLGEGQDGTPYIAMEFLEGEDLEHVINDQRVLPISQKLGYMVQVASALDYAHKRGVVHRDIKPANIVVTKGGTIKVVDFGIARLVDTSRSQTGLLIGTVNYMSPEQVRGERVDGRSDIFSVGVMCYEFLSGQRPFNGNNFTAVMLAIISQNHKPLKEVLPGCPDDLSEALDKILKKDVAERYQTLEEFLLDIDAPWKRLQKDQVAEMVAEGEKLMAAKDFGKARDILRQAIQIDTAHKHAKTLFEKVNAELKRVTVLPETQQRVAKAEALLKEGKLDEATKEAEAALKLDSVYQPAQDLRQRILDEANRQQLIKDCIRATRQRLAEGDLTAADQQLQKALEADAQSKEAQELKKQLDEEKTRRQKRQKLLDSMQQARNLWTQQKHDEALQILNGLQKEYPGEAEVAKLLDTVKEDQAEQEKHSKLAEAKSLLGAQRFADGLAVLEPLLQKYKNDTTVSKLYEHIQAERKEHASRVRMEKELAALKKLVADEKYADAVAKGEVLVGEFKGEPEFSRLVDYAREQQEAADRSSKIKNAIKQVEALFDKGQFAEAAAAADKALDSFPGNMDLKALLDDARTKQKDKEKKEYVEKQIRAIKASIETQNHTAAIDMARQTLAVVKHDTDLTQLLQYAQRERDVRDQKKSQEVQLQTIAVLAQKKKFDEAGQELKKAEKTQIIDPLDPRWQELMRAVKEKRAPAEEIITAKPGEMPVPGGTMVAPGQYVFQHGRPQAEEPNATLIGAQASAQPVVPQPTPAPMPPPKIEPEKPAPAKPEAKPPVIEPPRKDDKKGKPAVEELPIRKEEKKGKPAVEEPPKKVEEPPKKAAPAVVEPPKKEEPKKKEEEKKARPVEAPAPPKPRVEEPRPAPRPAFEPEPPKKSPVVMIAIAAVVVIAIGIGVWMMMGKGGGLTAEQQKVFDEATQLYGQRDLSKALGKYKELSATNNSDVTAKITEIQGILDKENAAMDAAKAAEKSKDWATARAKYQDAVAANGMRKQEAQDGLAKVEALAAGADPVKLSREGYLRAQNAIKARDWTRAINLLNDVIGYGQSETAKAQADLKTAQERLQEQKLFDEAQGLQNAGNKDGAKQKFQQVIALNGLRKADAEFQIKVIDGAITAEKARQEAIQRADGLIASGDFRGARALFQSIQQNGGDTAPLEAKITAGELRQFQDVDGKARAARTARNDAELRDLQGQARAISQGSGSQASNATQLERDIGTWVTEIANERRAQADETDWTNATGLFGRSQRDATALNGPVKTAFERIAGGGGKYATQAQDYVNNKIPELMRTLTAAVNPTPTTNPTPTSVQKPCPPFFTSGQRSNIVQNYPAGALVPGGLLDAKPVWTTCPWPSVSATVGLSLTVDENGNVSEAKARGAVPPGVNLEAVIASVKQWKAAPTPKVKGVNVKTPTAVDITP